MDEGRSREGGGGGGGEEGRGRVDGEVRRKGEEGEWERNGGKEMRSRREGRILQILDQIYIPLSASMAAEASSRSEVSLLAVH